MTRVLAVVDECPGVKTFRLSVDDDFTFLPGMFVLLHFTDSPEARRAFSISSSPLEKGRIEVTVGGSDDFTRRLFYMGAEASLVLRGPFGKWVYDGSKKDAALVAGGTGITPFRAMARYALAKGLGGTLSIFYSAKTPSEFIFREELADFARRGVKVHTTVTRPSGGRIDAALLKRELPAFKTTTFYLCGPKALVSGLAAGLEAAGIAPALIRRERWEDYSF